MSFLKGVFGGISLRERFLLLIFAWILLFFWATALLDRFGEEHTRYQRVAHDLSQQEQWFEERENIDRGLRTAMERLDPERTYNSTQLSGRLDAIARGANLNFDIASPNTQESDIFSVHSIRVQVRRARIADLIAFDAAIKSEFPYLGLEGFQINAPTRDPRELDAVFQIFSFELKADQF